jgi:hypothetical protein
MLLPTPAVLVNTPAVIGVTMIVTVAELPLANVPISQVTVTATGTSTLRWTVIVTIWNPIPVGIYELRSINHLIESHLLLVGWKLLSGSC